MSRRQLVQAGGAVGGASLTKSNTCIDRRSQLRAGDHYDPGQDSEVPVHEYFLPGLIPPGVMIIIIGRFQVFCLFVISL
ncbi:MAG: hypothetical protein JO313_15890 [Verrucomicrobia bacterium]|nr:hypothetical protein [Verrucomicrobiota bacterium]